MESRAFALIVGLFVLGLTGATVLTAHWLTRDPLDRAPYRVISTIPVAGLNPEGMVRYRGVPVGRVSTITIDRNDGRRILIGIEVATTVPVGRSTYAQLGMEGITGIAYVHLLDDEGSKEPPAKGPDGIPELPLKPSFFDSISDSAEGTVREARELMVALRAILTPENRARIDKTLASLERISKNLETTAERLPATIERLDARTQAWLSEENRQLARQTLRQIGDAAASVPELSKEAQQLVLDMRKLAVEINKLAEEARSGTSEVRAGTLPRVNALAEEVERGAARVGRLAGTLEREPSSVLFGRPTPRPGPGEPGFQ